MKSLKEFIAAYAGKVVDVNDGENWGWPGECVSLVQMYLHECYGERLIARGNGADWQRALLNEGLAVTTNYPVYGDIVVWGGNVANGLGHVSIYIDGINDFDQSTGARRTAQVRSRLDVKPIAYMHLLKVRPSDEVAAPSKTIDQLADEVIAGKWGTDPKRSKDLTAAGYDFKAIQSRVNEKLAPQKPSVPVKPPVTVPVKPNKVGQILKVRKGSYNKAKFVAYKDAACTIPLEPWTVANYDFDLGFKIVEDLDPVFKCSQYSMTPMSGIKHVYIKWESGIGFDSE